MRIEPLEFFTTKLAREVARTVPHHRVCRVGKWRAALLSRCEQDAAFSAELRARCEALRPLVDPVAERESWGRLLAELLPRGERT